MTQDREHDRYSRPFEILGSCSNIFAHDPTKEVQWYVSLARAKAAITTMPENIKQQAWDEIKRCPCLALLSLDTFLDLIADAKDFTGFSTGVGNVRKAAAWLLMDALRIVERNLALPRV